LEEVEMKSSRAILFWLLCFVLSLWTAIANGGSVRFAVIGDRTGGHVEGIYEKMIDKVETYKPEFALTVGDMIEGYRDDPAWIIHEWNEYDSMVSKLSMPLHRTPGNHDIWSDLSDSFFTARIGAPYRSFDLRGIHFVIIDNSRFEKTSEFPPDQLNWIAEDLSKNKGAAHIVALMHKPFWYDTVADGKPDTLHSLFCQYGVDAVFTGHFHDYFSGMFDGIIYTSVGSSGAETVPSPTGLYYHFAMVTVDDKGISIVPVSFEKEWKWDDFTIGEMKFTSKAKADGLSVTSPIEITDLSNLKEAKYEILLENICPDAPVDDTVRWTLPDGWSVTPDFAPIHLAHGQSKTLSFSATCSDRLYPLPTLSLMYPYASGKVFKIEQPLRVLRVADCVRAAEPPAVDGSLKEPVWTNAVTQLFAPDGSDMATDTAMFYFAHDDDNLYLAAICREQKMDSISASAADHDGGLFGEDCVGYFLQPDLTQQTSYQIYFNAIGTAFDQKLVVGEDGYADADRSWNGKYVVKTARGNGFWCVEIAIPLAQWNLKAESGHEWGINFRRKQARLRGMADFQPPIEYEPRSYGRLVMK
jgi:hypothetical protein